MNPQAPSFATCGCQHCDGNIEFDASSFDKGETRTAECPYCHMETPIFVQALRLSVPVTEKKQTYFAKGFANKACIVLLIASLIEIVVLKVKQTPSQTVSASQPLPVAQQVPDPQSIPVNEPAPTIKEAPLTASIIGKW